MLSLFYIPALIYNIVYNYLHPPRHEVQSQKQGIQSKYSSHQDLSSEKTKQSDSKSEIRNGDVHRVETIHITEQKVSPTPQKKDPDIVKVSKDSELPGLSCVADDKLRESSCGDEISPENEISHDETSTSSKVQDSPCTPISQNEPSSTSPAPTPPDQRKVLVALSESDSDSDSVDQYLADIMSVEPVPITQNILPPGPSDYQPSSIQFNSHVIIEDDSDEGGFSPVPHTISAPLVTPNSFAYVSQNPPAARNSDGTSSSSPETELPSYNGENDQNDQSFPSTAEEDPSKSDTLEVQGLADRPHTMKADDDIASGETSPVSLVNQAAACSGEVWGNIPDIPVETVSLTSQKRER